MQPASTCGSNATASAKPVGISFEALEDRIDAISADVRVAPTDAVAEMLAIGELVLERWAEARSEVPTRARKEGFRLLALHRQGAKGDPSFNACRETCRELAYHYNLVTAEPDHPETAKRVRLAAMVAKHLILFVGGKLEVAGLGEFCCASKPLRATGQ